MRLLFVLAIGLMVSGCLSAVQTKFTPYHSLTLEDTGKTVIVAPGMEELKGSLQFDAFKAKLENRFREAGYGVTDEVAYADYIAFFSYGIDGGTTTTRTQSMPIYGQIGGGTTYHSGSLSGYGSGGYGYGSYSGTSYTMPSYGVVGSNTYSYDVTTYNRVIQLEMIDREAFDSQRIRKVFEATLTSRGSCGQIAGIMDPLLDALFQDFPGESGKPRSVSIPYSAANCGK